jgi:DNA polymerase-4
VEKDHAVKQLDLFSYEKDAAKEPLLDTIEQLRKKYGETIIEPAADLKEAHQEEPNSISETSFSKDFLDFF